MRTTYNKTIPDASFFLIFLKLFFKELKCYEFLDKTDELLVLFTPWSFERPYVWAEIGAAWLRRIPIIVVLHGMTPTEFQAHPNAPVFLKKRDIININDIDQYFEQLERRIKESAVEGEE